MAYDTIGSSIKLIQRGSTTLTNTSGDVTGTITLPVAVDMSKTVITYLSAYTSQASATVFVSGKLTSTTEITVNGTSGNTSATITADWEVKEEY